MESVGVLVLDAGICKLVFTFSFYQSTGDKKKQTWNDFTVLNSAVFMP